MQSVFCQIFKSTIMKRTTLLLVWVFLMACLISHNAYTVVGLNRTEVSTSPSVQLDKAYLEKALGRELKFQEKLVLPLLKAKVKKGMDAEMAAKEAVTDGMALTSMILGIASLFVAGLILGLLAIIFSAIAFGRIKKNPGGRKGKGFAIAGLILGIIGVIGWAIAIIILLG